MDVRTVSIPVAETANAHYGGNRPPLRLAPLAKLPLGSVRPRGWLKHQLDLMVDGMTGRLTELSRFLAPDNGWFGGEEQGREEQPSSTAPPSLGGAPYWLRGREEQPYWLRGFHDLAVLTGNEHLLAEARRWLETVLASQEEDGYFGARFNKHVVDRAGTEGCDLWPHMVMLDAIIAHYEHTTDPRVIPMMTRFFAFCRDLPDDLFVPEQFTGQPVVQSHRSGDMLPHLYWLYNRTGDAWLLDLATRFYQHIRPPADEWLDHHIVHFTQRFRYPANYYLQSHAAWHLAASEYWYAQHLSTWGQQPRGIFGADEHIRPGCTDPRQGFETCGFVEFAKSFYILGQITGNPVYADRCEDLMLNHFPASQTPDLKALHYLTASNQPQLDASENHEYHNKGRQISYSPHIYRCCQHNVAMGWPWYAQYLWQATADNGLAAWLYAAAEVTARVGEAGTEVTINSSTDYPFEGLVTMTVHSPQPVTFPLYLRVPRWCHGLRVAVNREPLPEAGEPGCYIRILRAWSDGDIIEIEMPMTISLTQWPRHGSVTVDRGPLSYSLRIGERWQRCGGTDEWPEWEVFPTTPWNYGLLVDRDQPERSFEVTTKEQPTAQPWTVEGAPIELKARGKRLPAWRLENETVAELQTSPVKSDRPEEEITLIPLGCARLRMSCLPSIGNGLEAREWQQAGAPSHDE
ncbi:MAG: transcriptional initiation protein Tat [Dehalococcoidia bacterium]|nr:transcriptional initiation protein Tat [Dehalococcoidia bacterium]